MDVGLRGAKVNADTVTDVVLFSGGEESTLCAHRALSATRGREVALMFVDYGQPYATQEAAAAVRLAANLHALSNYFPMHAVKIEREGAVFVNRNQALIELALVTFPAASRIWIGVRAVHPVFDEYKDANAMWVREMRKHYGIYIEAPLLGIPSVVIRHRLRELRLLDLVFSSKGYDYGEK